jgi:hypothetical protein
MYGGVSGGSKLSLLAMIIVVNFVTAHYFAMDMDGS